MFAGLFFQEELGVGTPFWEAIPTSIQEIVGITVIMGVGWTWFVRPRMVALMAEAVAQVNQEFSKALGATRDEIRGDFSSRLDSTRDELRAEIAATRVDFSSRLDSTRDELRAEIAATRKDFSSKLDSTRDELRAEIAATRKDLSGEIAATRKDLSGEIAATRDELRGEIATTRRDLSGEIAATRDELRSEIAGNRGDIGSNRDSIVAVREMISAARIETRDLLTEMQRESRQAHAAIGDRITLESTILRTKIEEESTTLRTKVEELGTDTARLAGAVDVLTSIWREGDVRGELRTQ